MTARSRPPTDEVPTRLIESRSPAGRPTRPLKETKRGIARAEDNEPTVPDLAPSASSSQPIKVMSAKHDAGSSQPMAKAGSSQPMAKAGTDASSSQPIRVISMKTPADIAAEPAQVTPAIQHVKIRDLSSVRPRHATPPHGLGNLAPPRDERETRFRHRQDLMIWASVIVIVGSIVTLAIWFLAR